MTVAADAGTSSTAAVPVSDRVASTAVVEHRVVFDFEIDFSNGGGLQGQDFRLDIDGDAIDDAVLAEYLVRDLRLLMVGHVRIANKRIIAEAHKRPRIEAVDFDEGVAALLAAVGLPSADLADGRSPARLFGRMRHGRLVAVVGLECHGAVALLRSLAVADARRGQGLGRELLRHAEASATAAGVRALYLLTTDAAAYFARSGYSVIARDQVPAAIAATVQFAALCPASATLMRKAL